VDQRRHEVRGRKAWSCEANRKIAASEAAMISEAEQGEVLPVRQDPRGEDRIEADVGSHAIRGAGFTAGAHALKLALSTVATAVLARLLSPQDYGLVSMIAVATNLLSTMKDMGLSLVTIQKPQLTDEESTALFWLNAGLGAIGAGILAGLGPFLSWFFGEPRLTAIALVTAGGLIVGGLGAQHEALLGRSLRFVALGSIGLASTTLSYGAGILLAWSGYRYWSLIGAQLSLQTFQAVLVWVVCPWRPGRPRTRVRMRESLAFGRNVTVYSIINYAVKNADIVLMGRWWGTGPVGLYTRAGQLLTLATNQLSEPVGAVTLPVMSRLARSPERYREAYRRMVETLSALTVPIAGFIVGTADWIVLIALGPRWVDAGPILAWLSLSSIVYPTLGTCGWLLVTQGRTGDLVRLAVITGPISVLAILAGLPWGPVGVAAAYSLTRALVVAPLGFWLVGRKGPMPVSEFYRLTAPFISASGASLACVLLFRKLVAAPSPIIGLAVAAGLSASVTLLVLGSTETGRRTLDNLRRIVSVIGGRHRA
jgi:O-antigen/teichoic acid export membrane protein